MNKEYEYKHTHTHIYNKNIKSLHDVSKTTGRKKVNVYTIVISMAAHMIKMLVILISIQEYIVISMH